MNCGLQKKLGKNCQLTSQKLHFPRQNSSLKIKLKWLCKITKSTHSYQFLTDRVHWPSVIVRVTPLYWMCERVVYLHVAFLHHIHAANVCEKCVNCERIFCMNPVCVCVCMCACFIFHSSFVVIYQISKFQAPNLVSVWSYFYIRALSIENESECDSLFSCCTWFHCCCLFLLQVFLEAPVLQISWDGNQ